MIKLIEKYNTKVFHIHGNTNENYLTISYF